MRAYSDEIGGNAERALEQLDSFLGTSSSHIPSVESIKEEPIEDMETSGLDQLPLSYPSQKIRQDLIKAGVLLIIFIFVIVISQKIFNQESSAVVSKNGPVLQNQVHIISNEDLISGYLQDQFSEELLPTNSPFTIKLIPRKETAFSFKNGIASHTDYRLRPGVEQTLEKFKNRSELLFTRTEGLSIFINGQKPTLFNGLAIGSCARQHLGDELLGLAATKTLNRSNDNTADHHPDDNDGGCISLPRSLRAGSFANTTPRASTVAGGGCWSGPCSGSGATE